MPDVDDIIDSVLAHDSSRDAARIREYNRQYYLKNRKLKGRQLGDVKTPVGNVGSTNSPTRSVPVKGNSQERREIAAEKLRRAREKAKQLPPEKRNAVEKKLDAAEKKLKKLKGLNPFGKKDKKGPGESYTKAPSAEAKREIAKDAKKRKVRTKARRVKEARQRVADARDKAKAQKISGVAKKINEIERKIDRVQSAPGRAKKKVTDAPGNAKKSLDRKVRTTKAVGKALPNVGKAVARKRLNDAKKRATEKVWDTVL